MVDSRSAYIAVRYFDGKTLYSLGNFPNSFKFNKFLNIVSHKIGISPYQLSISLVKMRYDLTSSYILVERSRRAWKDLNLYIQFKNDPIIRDQYEYERRVKKSQQQTKQYMRNSGRESCQECSTAKKTGRDADFHCCVYDAVTWGFRTRAGPIARPVSRSG